MTYHYLLFLLLVVHAPLLYSQGPQHPLKVDLSQDNGRRDVLASDASHWRINDARESSVTIEGVHFAMRSLEPSSRMICDWWKRGFDHPALLASDGIVLDGRPDLGITLELRISGLKPGKHSFASYHNFLDERHSGNIQMSIDGRIVSDAFQPSRRVIHDDDSAILWSEFVAESKRDVVVTWKAIPSSVDSTTQQLAVVLNGFLIDVANPNLQGNKPSPYDGDEHAEETPVLKWSSPRSTLNHRLYLGTNREEVSKATPSSREYLGTTKNSEWSLSNYTEKVGHPLSPFETYYWRVDSIPVDHSEPLVPGKIWRFQVRRKAFPTAEGYGRFARGGLGGRVIEVTNLDDDGPGSLRAAIDAEGPRIVLFKVGGTIALKSKLIIRNPYITIAGQTAPGGGICVRGYTFGCLGTHDVILRHVRIRVGDEAQLTMDGTGFASTDHAIMDHCSVSWSIDEGVSSRGASNITFQRCIVAEALNIANHKKYQPGKGHSFAASISGNIGSFHHNLLAHCAGRNWSLAGGLDKGGSFAGRLDIRNNVVYNWEHRTNDGGVKALNLVNNFYIPGPATRVFHLLKPDAGTEQDPQQYFVAGNHMEGRDYDSDNWGPKSVVVSPDLLSRIRLDQPFCVPWITEQTANEAYASVTEDVGANIPCLDSLDQRILTDVRLRQVSTKGSRSGIPGIIDTQTDSSDWPILEQGIPELDSDRDGIPDSWESNHQLNPMDPLDAQQFDANFITNLEHYLDDLTIRRRPNQ